MSSSNNMPDLGAIAIISLVEQDLLSTYKPLDSKEAKKALESYLDSPRKKSKKEEKN
jgi:hypothetical protein